MSCTQIFLDSGMNNANYVITIYHHAFAAAVKKDEEFVDLS